MAGADYFYCPVCEQKALYDGDLEETPDVEVLHRECLERDRAEREKKMREQVAADIEAYQPTAHPAHCPPEIAWEAGREQAASIARHGLPVTD